MSKYLKDPYHYYGLLSELRLVDADTRERLFNEVMHEDNENKFKSENKNLTKSKGVACICRLNNKKCNQSCTASSLRFDHADLWLQNGTPHVFTFQPYRWSMDNFNELTTYCRDNGLSYELVDYNYHYPSSCNLIIVRKEVPTIYADENGKTQLKFYCNHCSEYHYHSKDTGHRVAHCTNKKSPYIDTGYILEVR